MSTDSIAHPDSPVAVAVADVSLRAEFAAYRAATEKRLAELEAEQIHARLAALEALAKNEFTPTLNEHDDRLDRVEVDVKRLLEMRADLTEVKAMQAEVLAYVRKFDRALDLGVIDPDPTPNMRGGK